MVTTIKTDIIDLPIRTFDVNGSPVCSIGVGENETCPFLTFDRFSQAQHCWWNGHALFRKDVTGYIQCDHACVLRQTKEELKHV